MIQGFHHIAISVADMEKSLSFYRDTLGFEVVMKGGWEQGNEKADQIVGLQDTAAKLIMLRKNGFNLELFEYRSPVPEPSDPGRRICDHGFTHICLEVSDIDSEYLRLKEAGMTFHEAPPEAVSGMRAIYGRDPEGNVIELLEIIGS
jgi:glyoxylase I family protein